MKITVVRGRKRITRYRPKSDLRTRTWTLRLGSEAVPMTLPGKHETAKDAARIARQMLHVTRLPKTARLLEV